MNKTRQKPTAFPLAQEKYHTDFRFGRALLKRDFLRLLLKPLARWQPLEQPVDGYTVVIGAIPALEKLLHLNLAMLARQPVRGMVEVIIALEALPEETQGLQERLTNAFASLPLKFIHYTPGQRRLLKCINWSWCNLWLNWSLATAAARTRDVILHDLDALLLQPRILEERWELIRTRGDCFVGHQYYRGNGVTPDDGLAVTYEMIFDCVQLREQLQPIDLFNKVRRFNGRRIELDTFLEAQVILGRSSIEELPSGALVHPSQLICQYAALMTRSDYVPPARNNLPLLPYFWFLAGDTGILSQHQRAFDDASGHHVHFLGTRMHVSHLTRSHFDWLYIQARRLERALAGEVRPQVQAYFASIESYLARQEQTQGRCEAERALPPI